MREDVGTPREQFLGRQRAVGIDWTKKKWLDLPNLLKGVIMFPPEKERLETGPKAMRLQRLDAGHGPSP